jgi:hypothetical protein
MAKVSLGDALTTVEVEVFGAKFKALPATRSVVNSIVDLEKKLEDAKDNDEQIAVIAELLDVRLKSANGSKKKASAIITEKWEADELGLDQIQGFVEDLNQAQLVRPT